MPLRLQSSRALLAVYKSLIGRAVCPQLGEPDPAAAAPRSGSAAILHGAGASDLIVHALALRPDLESVRHRDRREQAYQGYRHSFHFVLPAFLLSSLGARPPPE